MLYIQSMIRPLGEAGGSQDSREKSQHSMTVLFKFIQSDIQPLGEALVRKTTEERKRAGECTACSYKMTKLWLLYCIV